MKRFIYKIGVPIGGGLFGAFVSGGEYWQAALALAGAIVVAYFDYRNTFKSKNK